MTAFFRLILSVPILIILSLMTFNPFMDCGGCCGGSDGDGGVLWIGGILIVPTCLMILFREKYPRWWFDWNLAFTRFSMRVAAYFLLLRDEYPSTDEEQAVHADLVYPDVKKDLKRWMPLVKWFLAIPHVVVLYFLYIALVFCTVFAWFAVIFTGRYPKSLFDFAVGVLRWSLRVCAYCILLTTDAYPPFSLSE
jgi:hypothetical protein